MRFFRWGRVGGLGRGVGWLWRSTEAAFSKIEDTSQTLLED